jgi:phosphoglycolate phosphatase-like HAD superfamily hydrolase
MIKAIIFDFDGVLVESAGIKTEAFRKLFSKKTDRVDEIVDYHLKNMGISRYIKFKYFYENILKEPYSEEIGEELGRQFSAIVLDEIKKAPFVNGTIDFLERNYQKYLLFIASGTPQDELVDIVTFKGINKYFKGIWGTLATKAAIVENVFKKYVLQRNQVVFVGDAESDRAAAHDTGIYFIIRITPENLVSVNPSKYRINDLTQLASKLEEIEE